MNQFIVLLQQSVFLKLNDCVKQQTFDWYIFNTYNYFGISFGRTNINIHLCKNRSFNVYHHCTQFSICIDQSTWQFRYQCVSFQTIIHTWTCLHQYMDLPYNNPYQYLIMYKLTQQFKYQYASIQVIISIKPYKNTSFSMI